MGTAPREWVRARLRVPTELHPDGDADEIAGLVHSALLGAACLGVEVPVAAPGSEPLHDEMTELVAWFPAGTRPEAVEVALGLASLPASLLRACETVVDPGWVEAYNATLVPLDVGSRFTILPRGGEAPEGRLALHVEPGRAFGTGHHESTRLALGWLETCVRPGLSVLDVGTGSGILAFAAARLGARRVLGRDNDPEAIEVALENLARLPERDVVRLEIGGGAGGGREPWDVVVANITIDVILPLLDELVGALAPGGALVLAGLLARDRAAVDAALEARGLSARWATEGEWSSALASSR